MKRISSQLFLWAMHANGKKMKPHIVFKGKWTCLIKELQTIPDVIVLFSSNGWMNDSLTADYLQKIIGVLFQ